jgi:hypothetical protein
MCAHLARSGADAPDWLSAYDFTTERGARSWATMPAPRSVRSYRRAHRLGAGDQRGARLGQLVSGQMDRDAYERGSSGRHLALDRDADRPDGAADQQPIRCARTRSASMSTPSTGAANSSPPSLANGCRAGARYAVSPRPASPPDAARPRSLRRPLNQETQP